jgi:DNA ligase (NAD+)
MSTDKTSNVNKLGKVERNAKVLADKPCIFPFKTKRKEYNECIDEGKGKFCATQVSKRGTLQKYGYCEDYREEKQEVMNEEEPKYTLFDFAKALEELSTAESSLGQPFKARAYQKAAEQIYLHPELKTPEEIRMLKGISKKIYEKAKIFMDVGSFPRLEAIRRNPVLLLTGVYGIGNKAAQKLVEGGITTIEKLREENEKNDKLLNRNQKKGLEYYDDINKRIPRAEIVKHEELIRRVLNDRLRMEIVGSYRRGNENSGDIDVILTHDSQSEGEKMFTDFMRELEELGYIEYVFAKGKKKALVVSKLEDGKVVRRVDFLFTPKEQYPFAVLYFTGSKYFNIHMREYALRKGFSLNEQGFKSKNKIEAKFENEEDIFKFLNLEYIEPSKRTGKLKVIQRESPVKLKAPVNKKERMACENENIEEFKKGGVSYLDRLTEKEISDMIILANHCYYNTKKALLSDSQYDVLKYYAENKYPKMEALEKIGAQVLGEKIKLPYFMPSMDKIKNDPKAIRRFISTYKTSYVISDKLDGISGMIYCKKGDTPKLYTRGDGEFGQEITTILRYIQGLPFNYNDKCDKDMVVRGEIIVPKSKYEKYKNDYSNARVMANSLATAKTLKIRELRNVHFVAYELIVPSEKPEVQFSKLEEEGYEVVYNRTVNNIDETVLSETLTDRRENGEYDIDGIIVVHNKKHNRTKKNPKHAFAFKMVMNDQMAETNVLEVEWNISKNGYFKPRVKIEKVNIGGTNIEYVTGHNARYIEDNGIGVGAVISIIRSGDVIPKIHEVHQRAEVINWPDEGTYKWDENRVEIVIASADSAMEKRLHIKELVFFFSTLKSDFLREKTIEKLYDLGITRVRDYVELTEKRLVELGIGDKSAKRIIKSIDDSVMKAKLVDLMGASNKFGRGMGKRKIQKILKEYPEALNTNIPVETRIENTLKIKGMASKTVNQFYKSLESFERFMVDERLMDPRKEVADVAVEEPKSVEASNKLEGTKVVFTGVRDNDLEKVIQSNGGEISSSVSSKTTYLVVKDKTKTSGKMKKAEKLGIPIMELEEFRQHLQTLL